MAVSYKKLWKLLIDKDMKKKELEQQANVFNEVDFCICRLDKLARNEQLQEKLKVSEWDLIVCDEAHKMSATVWGGEIKYTKRFQLGKLLSNITKNFLLLTATPHIYRMGKA